MVAAFIGLPRSHFYLYDIRGDLVYHELLPEDAKTNAVIPAANDNQEVIIGGNRTIWKYALNRQPPEPNAQMADYGLGSPIRAAYRVWVP